MTGILTALPLIAQAAPTSGQQQGSPMAGLISFAPMILIIVAMWFLIIAPQRKKMKEHQKMVEALSTGDEVLTTGGIFGTIVQRKEDRFVVRISDNCKVEVEKSAIGSVLKKG